MSITYPEPTLTEPTLREVDPPQRPDAATTSPADSGDVQSSVPPRRFEWLPVTGEGAPSSPIIARGHGASVSSEGLSELITSIARCGVLAPLLVEEIEDEQGVRRLLVTGDRRLRACRLGAAEAPNNPHFARVPALVCAGPLSDAQRSSWQISENVSREDLPPGRLGAALITARTDLLLDALREQDLDPQIEQSEDAVERWRAADAFRARYAPAVSAPWASVLAMLGISFGPRKARLLVAAFSALPSDVSTEMDAAAITLSTRTTLVRAVGGQREFARDIWAAVASLGRPELLAGTARAISEGRNLDDAIEAAGLVHDGANEARRVANSNLPEDEPGAPRAEDEQGSGVEGASPRVEVDPVTAAAAETAITALRDLVERLREGQCLDRYTAGSVRLWAGRVISEVSKS